MKKRWYLRLSVIALLGTAGFVVLLMTRPASPINRVNFKKIQVGMTLAEVEAIIGLPPGDYSTGSLVTVEYKECTVAMQVLKEMGKEADEVVARKVTDGLILSSQTGWKLFGDQSTALAPYWICDSAAIIIEWDPSARDFNVGRKNFLSVRRSYDGFWQRIRGWLRI
ncbi:MAG: hypothetical protein L0Y71_00620 [Gemmataceae bacterium]|nr:hypothetical protein [Gemmataceae bacterium]